MKTLPTFNAVLELCVTDAFDVRGPDLREPSEPLATVAREALHVAWERHGGELYTNDGDARLDMECVPGDLYAAVGYVLNHLAKNGFTTLVIQAEPAPDDSGGA